MLINLFYILLFAIATVIIYIWGMKKEQSKDKELLDNLYKKSEKVFCFFYQFDQCNDFRKESCKIRAAALILPGNCAMI